MGTITLQRQERDRRAGAIGTVLVHVLLFLLFLFFGLEQPDPLPEEQGIELVFEDAGGLTGASPESDPGTPQESANPVPAPVEPEEVATEEEGPVTMPKPAVPKPRPKPEPETPKPPKPNPNALFTPSSTPGPNQSTDPGGSSTPGSQPGGGGLGTFSGNGFIGTLEGRGLGSGPRFRNDNTKAGKVAVNILVDRNGKVLEARHTLDKPTTTTEYELIKLAEGYAKEITFTPKPDAPDRQRGQVVFTFTLQ